MIRAAAVSLRSQPVSFAHAGVVAQSDPKNRRSAVLEIPQMSKGLTKSSKLH